VASFHFDVLFLKEVKVPDLNLFLQMNNWKGEYVATSHEEGKGGVLYVLFPLG
jgi:hypothetical protein